MQIVQVVMDTSVDFARYLKDPTVDMVVTDHNRMLNNGAVVLRNTPWTRGFLKRWAEISRKGPSVRGVCREV